MRSNYLLYLALTMVFPDCAHVRLLLCTCGDQRRAILPDLPQRMGLGPIAMGTAKGAVLLHTTQPSCIWEYLVRYILANYSRELSQHAGIMEGCKGYEGRRFCTIRLMTMPVLSCPADRHLTSRNQKSPECKYQR